MKVKLNIELISKVSNAFSTIFLKSVKDTSNEKYTFLNMLLGFVYASKKLLNSMQALGILTSDEVKKIDEQLTTAAIMDLPNGELIEVLKNIIKEEGQ